MLTADSEYKTILNKYDNVILLRYLWRWQARGAPEAGPMRTSKPISVTLGPQQASLERRLRSGEYDSASEVLRHALRALDREEAMLDEVMRERVRASLADPRPSIPAHTVFKRLRARHGRRLKAATRDA
jgi:antitoxin ParD1/3/4